VKVAGLGRRLLIVARPGPSGEFAKRVKLVVAGLVRSYLGLSREPPAWLGVLSFSGLVF